MNEAYVKKYIDVNTSEAIRKKAREIYNLGNVTLLSNDAKNKNAEFGVLGNKKYTVLIQNYNTNMFKVACSCPYDWGNLCKHGLASLYFLINNPELEHTAKSKKQFKREPNEPVEVFEANLLKEDFLNDYNLDYDSELDYYKFEILALHENLIEISAEIKNYTDYNIIVEKREDKFFISSTFYEKKKSYPKPHLYEPEAAFLFYLSLNNPSFLKNIFSTEMKGKAIEKAALIFGIKNSTDAEKFFDLSPNIEETFVAILKKKYSGLIPVEENERKNSYGRFIDVLTEKKDTKLTLESKKPIKKDFVLGFMVCKGREYGNKFEIVEFVVLKGAIQKKGDNLIKIKAYDSEFDAEKCKITENQNSIISAINDFYEGSSAQNNFDVYISKLKNIFHLLKDEKFVFHHSAVNGFDSYYDKILKSNLERISIPKDNLVNLKIEIAKNEELIEAKNIFFTQEKIIDLSKNKSEYAAFATYVIENKLYIATSYKTALFYANIRENSISMLKEYEEEFVENYVMPLSQNWDLSFAKDLKYGIKKEHLEAEKKQIFLEEEEDYLVIIPQVKYEEGLELKLTERQDIFKKNGFEITHFVRDKDYENEYLDFIASLHKSFETQKEDGLFYIPLDDLMEDMWFFNFFDKLNTAQIEIFGFKELKKFKYSPYKAAVKTNISSGEDWFDVEMKVSFGNQNISLKDIQKAIVNKDKFIKLSDDSIGILPEEWLEKMEPFFRHGEVEKGQLKVSKMKFSVIDTLFEDIDHEEILKEINEKKQLLKQFKEIDKIKVPKEINATLRDYQKEGLNWLHFLHKMKWGGILADDMGLGKTIQIITLLQSIKNKNKHTSLIIVPTSLLFNWENELDKFAPDLNAFFYYGADRDPDENLLQKQDIVITTYGIMAKDIEFLAEQKFYYVILDESQSIKNPNSQRYKASRLLNAKYRLALTGTPIENNTFDLYAQMNFVNPGFFGSIKAFKDNYAMPIDRDADVEMAEELQKLISPFLLRRTKEQVATELPPKTEDVIYCEMLPKQQKIYDAYKNEYRNTILEKIETDGLNKSKLFVLSALTKLRQICDSPLLLKDKHIENIESAKIKILLEHINEKTANHKILIFSQFTSMLALIKKELDKTTIRYEYLDGKSSSTNRQKSVENFQNDSKIRVFLISLKAGGTGLNLTAADYVYIVDPWWNPAVENQAIDRCYRIGQDKKVIAYRLICKNTIEEKIIKLQNKKKQLASDIIQTDDKIMKSIDKSSLMDLFS